MAFFETSTTALLAGIQQQQEIIGDAPGAVRLTLGRARPG
jgi:hypothetical protein